MQLKILAAQRLCAEDRTVIYRLGTSRRRTTFTFQSEYKLPYPAKPWSCPGYPAAPASGANITEMRGDGFSRRNVLYPSPRKLTCAASEGTQLGFRAPVLQSSRLGKEVKIARKSNFLVLSSQRDRHLQGQYTCCPARTLLTGQGDASKKEAGGTGCP